MVCKFDQHLPGREGAIEAVARMARSYKVALVTGSPTDLATDVMQVTGHDKVFQACVYGDDVIYGKPAPDIYLAVLHKMGVSPKDAVGIEDELSLADCRINSMTGISAALVEKVGFLNRNP